MADAVKYVSLTPADFLTDKDFQVWDAALCGAYCRIIFSLYENDGYLDPDPQALRIIANWHGEGWDEAWNKLRKKFRKTKRGLKHNRVTKELREAITRMKAKRAAGLAGAKARWQTHGNRNAAVVPSKGKVSKGIKEAPYSPPCEEAPPGEPPFVGQYRPKAHPEDQHRGEEHMLACWKHAHELDGNVLHVLPLDDWVGSLLQSGGLNYIKTFTHGDFLAASNAYYSRTNEEWTWTGKWVVNARNKRLEKKAKREHEARKKEDRAAAAQNPLTKNIGKPVLTEGQELEAFWKGLTPERQQEIKTEHEKAINHKSTWYAAAIWYRQKGQEK